MMIAHKCRRWGVFDQVIKGPVIEPTPECQFSLPSYRRSPEYFHIQHGDSPMKPRGSGRIASAIAVALSSQFLFAAPSHADGDRVGHVLLISIDGFHAFDLTSCVPSGACPNLAAPSHRGVTYTNARTTTPSDSFPGLLSQLTGGTPKT